MTSAREREDSLRPRRDRAQQAVAELEAEISRYKAEAHSCYVAGDTGAGDAAHEKATALKPDLAAARAQYQTLEEAILFLGQQRQVEELEARLTALDQQITDEVAAMHRDAAEVTPHLAAAKMRLRGAQQHQDSARLLEAERDEVRIALGHKERGRFYPSTNAMQAMLERHPYLTDLLRNPDF